MAKKLISFDDSKSGEAALPEAVNAALRATYGRVIQVISNGGADQSARIQTALDAPAIAGTVKTVKLIGHFIHASTLYVGSNTTVDLTEATGVLNSPTSANMWRNKAVLPAATGTGNLTSGSATLTTAVTATVGQTVTVAGADSSGTTAFTANVVAVGSGTLTLSTAAKRTVTGAAVKVFNRDSNIKIVGGVWDRGTTPSGGGNDNMNFFFRHVDGLTLDSTVRSTTGKYVFSVGDVTNFWIRGRNCKANSDGVHVTGPAKNGHVEEMSGDFGDDIFAITANDWAAYSDTSGDVSDITIGNLRGTSTANLVKVLAGAGCAVSNVRVLGQVSGIAGTNGGYVGDDIAQPSTTGGTYRDIDLGTINAVTTNAGLYLLSPHVNTLRARIRTVRTTGTSSAIKLYGSRTCTIDLLDVDVDMDASPGTALAECILVNNANATVKKLLLRNPRLITNAAGGSLVKTILGAVHEIAVENPLIQFASTTVSYIFHIAGAMPNRVSVDRGSITGGSVVVRKEAPAGAGTLYVSLGGGLLVSDMSRVGDCRAGTMVVKLTGPHFANIVSAAFFASGGGYVFEGTYSSEGTFSFLQRAGSESIRSRSLNLPFDVALLTKVAGDAAYNTNAAQAGGMGAVVCDGAKWVNTARPYTVTDSAGAAVVKRPKFTLDAFGELDDITMETI